MREAGLSSTTRMRLDWLTDKEEPDADVQLDTLILRRSAELAQEILIRAPSSDTRPRVSDLALDLVEQAIVIAEARS